jgi:nitroimidazol reductase NimA-like FMN-containing flavoprotein (pyridoxamine 5'-phosphate oxidase superfamily)
MTVAYRDLSRERCLALLSESVVGRIAYCSGTGPRLYPVNYALDGETIVFRTAAYTALGTEIAEQSVAFEVDQVDAVNGHGWSVVVNGRATIISDPDEAARLGRRSDPHPWAPGVRPLYVRIAIHRISGRAIGSLTD